MFRTPKLITAIAVVLASAGISLASGNWQTQIEEGAATLRSADYSKSSKVIDRTIAEMVERLGGGQAEDQMFATALLQKALASAGQGSIDDALWYWYVAQQISPAVAKTDLTPFGAPGEYLTRHPMTQPDTAVRTTAPRVIKQVVPKFPP